LRAAVLGVSRSGPLRRVWRLLRGVCWLVSELVGSLLKYLYLASSAAGLGGKWLGRAAPLLLPLCAAAAAREGRLTVADAQRVGAALRRRARSRAALCAAAAAAAGAAATTNEGLRRSMVFNRKMVPLALEYNFHQWLLLPASEEERVAAFQRLHERHAPSVLAAILDLRGFYIKIGQVISSFGDSFVPTQFVDALSVLHDAAPAQPLERARAIVESELGVRMGSLFSSFDPEPLGSASIGQVHAATLRGGPDVVVKIQYPEAERFFTNDLRALKNFCRVFSPSNVELMEEIEKQFETEFDYRRDPPWRLF